MKLLIAFVTLVTWNVIYCNTSNMQCKPNGFQCINETVFVICVDIGKNILIPTPTTHNCPKGFLCADDLEVPCIEPSVMNTTDVNPSKSKNNSFTCKKPGKFSGPSCQEYYHCINVVLWIHKKIKKCPNGLWFNATTQKCVAPHLSSCIQ